MRLSRRRYFVLVCVAALVAALLGTFLTARLTWRWQSRQMETLLAEQLQTTQEYARDLFKDVFTRMDRVGEAWTGGCGGDAIQHLRNIVFYSPTIREAQFLDQSFTVVCSNYGAPPRVFTLTGPEQQALRRAGVSVVWVPESAVMKAQAVAVNRIAPKGAINVLIDPSFLDQALERDVIQPGMWSGLRLADGAIMAGSDKEDQGTSALHRLPNSANASWWVVEAPVEGVPVTAIAAMPKPTLAGVRGEFWPLIAGVGLLAGVAAFAGGLALMRRRMSLDAELRAAIANDELVLHYQPLVDLQTGACVGVEALMRWRHPERGLVRPDLFIPQAEDSGLIVPMTEWAMQRIIADFPDGPPVAGKFHVSINLTRRHFSMPDLAAKLEKVFARSALKPMHIVLEATERQVMDATIGTSDETIAALRHWGAAVSLDDFGTGYCGLKYLQQYRVDYLKIDKSFVDSIGTDAVSAHVVDAIIDLARRLDTGIVAEGVERQEQADYLRARGVRLAQGYLFAKPMPIGDFLAFARR